MPARRWLAAAAVATLAALGASAPRAAAAQPVPQLAAPNCDTGGANGGTGARPDSDADGLNDDCEHDLARAFAPELVVDAGECGRTAADGPALPDGAYLYVVGRAAADTLRIAYLPAYYADCGWSGSKCLLTRQMCRGHAGDSELILVDVVYQSARARWAAIGVFLSAHCHGTIENRCRWYRGPALDSLGWAGGDPRAAPVVWVARGTHASYPSRQSCDQGFWNYDTCDANEVRLRYPVLTPAQNAGSRGHPFGGRADADGCIAPPAPTTASTSQPPRRECIWALDGAFTGWRPPDGDLPTPYGRHLRDYAGF